MSPLARLTPAVLDLALYAGDGLSITVTVTDSRGSRVVLEGTWRAMVRATRTSATAVTLTVNAAAQAEGVVVVTATGAQVSSFDDTGVWDLEYTPTAQEPVTLLTGAVSVLRDVSRT